MPEFIVTRTSKSAFKHPFEVDEDWDTPDEVALGRSLAEKYPLVQKTYPRIDYSLAMRPGFELGEDGVWYRQTGTREGWFVSFDTLNDLLAFQKDVGNIILSEWGLNHSITHIEIYDDYRE